MWLEALDILLERISATIEGKSHIRRTKAVSGAAQVYPASLSFLRFILRAESFCIASNTPQFFSRLLSPLRFPLSPLQNLCTLKSTRRETWYFHILPIGKTALPVKNVEIWRKVSEERRRWRRGLEVERVRGLQE